MTTVWEYIRQAIVATGEALAPHWPALLAVVLGVAIVLVVHRLTSGVTRRLAAADARLARLADPTRCHRCGAELDTYDDVITPHDCPGEGR